MEKARSERSGLTGLDFSGAASLGKPQRRKRRPMALRRAPVTRASETPCTARSRLHNPNVFEALRRFYFPLLRSYRLPPSYWYSSTVLVLRSSPCHKRQTIRGSI